jgi:hypothetical protein
MTTRPLIRFSIPLVVAAAFALTFLYPNKGSAQAPGVHSRVLAINSYAKQIDSFIKIKPKVRIFGDASLPEDEKSKWQEFKSVAKLEEDQVYESAKIWLRQNKVVCANFTLSSPSGDWTQFVWYYFREDGSLAKIREVLNTFHGNASVHREYFFDQPGKSIFSTRKILDLKTQRPRKSIDFMDQPAAVFQNVTDLPFYTLL